MKTPTYIFIGPGKSATTWLHKVLMAHPGIFVTEVKETNFFDLNYAKGLEWYAGFFANAPVGVPIGEISHRYIHNPEMAERIYECLGQIRVVAGFREPVDYCMSDYLFTKRNGGADGNFRQWCEKRFDWETIAYDKMLTPWLDTFGARNIFVYDFHDIAKDPQVTCDALCNFLEVEPRVLSDDLLRRENVAAKARLNSLAWMVNKGSKFLKRRGGQSIIARVKNNKVIRKILYKELSAKPQIDQDLVSLIREKSDPQIQAVDRKLNTRFFDNWYVKNANHSS